MLHIYVLLGQRINFVDNQLRMWQLSFFRKNYLDKMLHITKLLNQHILAECIAKHMLNY